jgi:hypothetical protein
MPRYLEILIGIVYMGKAKPKPPVYRFQEVDDEE